MKQFAHVLLVFAVLAGLLLYIDLSSYLVVIIPYRFDDTAEMLDLVPPSVQFPLKVLPAAHPNFCGASSPLNVRPLGKDSCNPLLQLHQDEGQLIVPLVLGEGLDLSPYVLQGLLQVVQIGQLVPKLSTQQG